MCVQRVIFNLLILNSQFDLFTYKSLMLQNGYIICPSKVADVSSCLLESLSLLIFKKEL
jgi:hypothetical protein